jgi:hypothetical protein
MLMRALFAALPVFFALTLFLSAGLLFLVEPMIAKMILPLLGGTPAVWNTCMMFFQALLLVGYGYAHIVSKKAGMNRQIIIHLVILVAACLALPISIPREWTPSAEGSPIGYILSLLLVSVGLPFFVLSSNSLLLQKWFSGTGHPSAKDPYFLYSAGNLGSMLALIGYPILVEPYLRLAEQSNLWTFGYILLMAATVFCAGLSWKFLSVCLSESKGTNEAADCVADDPGLTLKERSRWVILAFVPSSLMLGVTTFLSTDVAAIPLFWVIPLSLYLLSFIIVFARVPAVIHRVMVLLLPVSIIALIFVNFSYLDIPKWVIFIFHLANFFIYSMVCHGEIARSRPATRHLTEFYLWVSVGGVLGGIFNALVAPVVFNAILEYPLILVFGAILLPVRNPKRPSDLLNWKHALLYLGVSVLLAMLTYWLTMKWPVKSVNLAWLEDLLHVDVKYINRIITYGSLGLLCYGLVFLKKPLLFGFGVASLLMTLVVSNEFTQNTVYRERSFFGVLTVSRDSDGKFMQLSHGTTIHGRQWLDADKRREPIAYYHREGPAGSVFAEFSEEDKKYHIAVTGLGVGTLAAYAGPAQEIDFYEIDPAVKRIATNPAYFSYLKDCRAKWEVILGDARLTMERARFHKYGIIILDAFSSDAIPVHLITKEAVNLYFSKLQQDGLLLVHISNKYVNLAPVLADLAYENGFACRINNDDDDDEAGKYSSTWVLMARKEKDFGSLTRDRAWEKIERQKTVKAWTDDFSNLLSVFKW